MAESFGWTCPFCQHAQTVTEAKQSVGHDHINISGLAEGDCGVYWSAIGCSNPNCRHLSLTVQLTRDAQNSHYYWYRKAEIRLIGMIPASFAKVLPEYVPPPIVEDYAEACAVRDLSPKASATLARRCLQGMIRDFCGIQKKTLYEEITALKAAADNGTAPVGVSPDSIEAIDAVRTVGNIGAHMEADINVIVGVDADEAQILIDLIESLIEDWYIARKKREDRFAATKAIAEEKKRAKQAGGLPPDSNSP